ncbi:hypothetical protein [Mesonia sp. K7]|uniref:hypothetical protein n=1 Tax=Mesonia sp. K7 TaxID=2218606 RepID=UPI000DA8CB07|nr:hypothetical protein [Mesonia sp. K7]PZD79626.1 hypothetical protein DNG35_01055 [Mesonia sp. K7]
MRINQSIREINSHDPAFNNNFMVAGGHSYIEGEIFEETRAYIKIPVSNANYLCYSIYNISCPTATTVYVVITDNTHNERKPEETTHILELDFMLHETGITSLYRNKLQIIVLSDHPEDFNSSLVDEARTLVSSLGLSAYEDPCDDKKTIDGIKTVQPQEACGGVITRL